MYQNITWVDYNASSEKIQNYVPNLIQNVSEEKVDQKLFQFARPTHHNNNNSKVLCELGDLIKYSVNLVQTDFQCSFATRLG